MAKRTNQKATRKQMLEQMRAEQHKRERRSKRILVAVIAVGAIAAAVAIGAAAKYGGSSTSSSIAGLQTYGKLSQSHVTTPVTYPQTPPVGGDHNPQWLNCGIYTSPVPNENAVHDLEHGAVWITYRPSLAAADVEKLTALVRGKSYVDLSPYPGLPAPVVASAWGKQLRLSSVTDPRIAQFISTYAQGPQTPEPGAPCVGGVGTPAG